MFKMSSNGFFRLSLEAFSGNDWENLVLLRSSCPDSEESSHGRVFFRFALPAAWTDCGPLAFVRINGRKDGRWCVQTYGDRDIESVTETDRCLSRLEGDAPTLADMLARTGYAHAHVKGRGFHCKFVCGSLAEAMTVASAWHWWVRFAFSRLCGGLEKHGRRGILESCDRMLSHDRAFRNGIGL